MLFKSLAVTAAAALAGSASAHLIARNTTRSCGTPDPTKAQVEVSQQMLRQERTRVASRQLAAIEVDTYFHVVAASESEADGYATVRKNRHHHHHLP